MKRKYLTLLGILGIDMVFLGAMLSWILSEFVFIAKAILIWGILVLIVWLVFSWRRTREFLATQKFSRGTSTVLGSIFFIGILIIANILGVHYKYRTDLTSEKLYTLSDGTEKLIPTIDRDVEIILFDSESSPVDRDVIDLITEYSELSPRIKHKIIDPDRQPQMAKKYGVSKYGQVAIICGDKSKLIDSPDEQKITNSIKQLVSGGGRKVYFLTGHKEFSPYSKKPDGLSSFADGIKYDGFDFDTLNLLATGKIPEDASVLIVCGPKSNPIAGELDTIGAYFERGGKVFIMLEPGQAESVAVWLQKYNVKIFDDMVIDVSSNGRMFGLSPEMPLITAYEAKHPITRDFNEPTMLPTARSMVKIGNKISFYKYTELARSSRDAWAEFGWRSDSVEYNPAADIEGPVTVACALESPNRKVLSRMVIIGDPDFVTNKYITFSGNKDFALNCMDWLGEQENLISIRPKNPTDRKLNLTPQQQGKIFYFSVVALPFLALILAEIVWWKRQ